MQHIIPHSVYGVNPKKKNLSWTPELIEFIKTNYPLEGSVGCSSKLKISIQQIQDIVKFYKIKMPKKNRILLINKRINDTKKYKIYTEKFLSPSDPQTCYILGLLWADGSIRGANDNSVRLTLKQEDGENVIPIIKTTGNWSIKKVQYKIHRNPVICFRCCDKIFHHFLVIHDYYEKSYKSAEKIISIIPEDFRHYWWRGYFDGDGTLNKNNYGISITSTFNQDWSFLNLLPSNVSYKIKQYQRSVGGKIQSYSRAVMWGRENVLTFLNYIYAGPRFGINRKYTRYQNKLKFGYKGY